jgi:bifunctional DNA-binding transcriptional regulator/antitoxin component of YhaV-PrlF toxin-antitoxin module
MTIAVQMRAKGSLTIPSELRQKYGFDEGDVFTLVELGDGSFLLTPRVSLVPKLVAEMEAIRTEAGVTLDDLLSGLPEVRRQLFEEKQRQDE